MFISNICIVLLESKTAFGSCAEISVSDLSWIRQT